MSASNKPPIAVHTLPNVISHSLLYPRRFGTLLFIPRWDLLFDLGVRCPKLSAEFSLLHNAYSICIGINKGSHYAHPGGFLKQPYLITESLFCPFLCFLSTLQLLPRQSQLLALYL